MLMKRRIYLLCTSLALSIWAIGQVQVRGTVQSDEGRPLEGATVTIKGTKIATIANSEGVFVIEVPSSSSTLVISSVGFLTKEQPASSNVMDIILRKDDRRLSEVVVVGYGQSQKRNVSGSISRVVGREIENQPVQSF